MHFTYIIHSILILIINFAQSPYYFISSFLLSKQKIKHFLTNSVYFVVNYGFIADLVMRHKPNIFYLASHSNLTRELPQHLEMIRRALGTREIYCPAAKGAKHDGCFVNIDSNQVTKVVQFKLKEDGSGLSIQALGKWFKKYSHLDELNIGFRTLEDFERHKEVIIKANKLIIFSGGKLRFTSTDYSSCELEATCNPDIPALLNHQAGLNEHVTTVNSQLDKFGEFITQFPKITIDFDAIENLPIL